MNYIFKENISEHREDLKRLFLGTDNLILNSPPDSGKTYSTLEILSNCGGRFALVSPYQTLVDNIEYKYASMFNVKCGYGKEFIELNKTANLIATTYDTFLAIDKPFDAVFIDEAHIIAAHGNFRTDVLAQLMNVKCKKVLMSGTPEVIEYLDGFTKVDFVRKHQRYKEVNIIENLKSKKANLLSILDKRDKSKLTIIRVNDKELCDYAYNLIKHEGGVVKLYSDKDNILCANQDPEIVSKIKSGVVPSSINTIICTQVLDAGLSLEVSTDVIGYAIEERRMPNAIDMIQFIHRVRNDTGHKFTLNIVGSFGIDCIPEDYKFGKLHPNRLIQEMYSKYAIYQHLDKEDYINLLGYYGLRVSVKQDTYIPSLLEFISQANNIDIAKNLHNFPQYPELREYMKCKGYNEWCEYFDSGNIIYTTYDKSKVERVCDAIGSAIALGLHPKYYMKDKFLDSVIKDLVRIDDDRSNERFRAVLNQLLEGYYLNTGDAFKMDLSEFSLLSEPHKNSIKTVANILYKHNRQWKRNTIKMTRLEHDADFESFISFYLVSVHKQSA